MVRKSSLTILVFAGAALAAPSTGAAQDGARRVFRESVSVTTDAQVVKRIGTAQDHLAEKEWDEAVPILQQIIETSGEALLPLETGRYGNAADFCHLLISRLPPEGLAAYRVRVDLQAAEWLEQAQLSLDPVLFGRVVSVAFNSSSGDDALWQLGNLAFEQGRYAVARQHWQQLVVPVQSEREDGQEPVELPYLTFPDSSFDAASVRARLILCTIFEGHGERARRELDVFEKLHPEAEGTLAGKTGLLSGILKATFETSRQWRLGRVIPDELTTFAGKPDRNPLPVPEHSPGSRLWTRRLPEIQFRGQAPPALRGPQWQLCFHPVVHRDVVYLCTSHSIFALDLATGESPSWLGEPPESADDEEAEDDSPKEEGDDEAEPRGLDGVPRTLVKNADTKRTRIFTNSTENAHRIIRDPIGITRYTMTIADGRLYARMGPPISRRSPHEGAAISEIVGLDIESGQGLLVFRVTSDILDPDAASPEATAWSFEGTPLVADGRVYVTARRGTPEDEIAVACFDASSSQLLWQQRVCSNLSTVFDRSSLLDHRLLTLGDGRLFLTTGTGAIASLDAATGRVLWIVTYDSGARTPDRRTTFLDEANHPARNGLLPCVYHRGTVFAATPDANRLFALDATTGQLVWQSEQASGEWLRHILGVVGDRLIACGNQLMAFDIHTGATAWRIAHPNPDAWTHGRGVLTSRSVYWPLRGEIVRVSIRSGEIQRRFQLRRPDGLEGGHLAVVGDRMLLVTHDRITALRNRDAPPPADPDRSVGQRGETPGEAASSSLDRALRRARAAEDHFRPDIATAQFRSALERSAKPELTAEDKEYGEHVAARGLVRSSVALANVSRGPAKQPYLQTAWRTAQDHPRAFRPSERIERLLEFVEAEPDRREASLAIKRFLDESSLAAEPWLFPMQFGEPVRQTVGAALDAAENGNIPPDPGQASIKPVKAPQDSARLLRRSWVRVVSPKARVIVPEERESLTPRFLIQDSKLTCLQSSNGTRLWEAAAGIDVRQAFQLPASQREAVKFSEAMLLFGEDSIQCRDVLSGEVRWSTRWPGRVRFEFAQLSESRPLVFCISDDSVAAVDPHSGAEQWQFPPRSQPASASDSGRRRTPRSNFYRDGTVGLFQSITHTDSFLLDLRTGFPLARAKANLPSDGQLKFGQSQDGSMPEQPGKSGWAVVTAARDKRLIIRKFVPEMPARLIRSGELGVGLHVPVLLEDQSPFGLLIENGLMAERFDVPSGLTIWRRRLAAPLAEPNQMTSVNRDALFATTGGKLTRYSLTDGEQAWQRQLAEGHWWIAEANSHTLIAVGVKSNSQELETELVMHNARSGDAVQRFRFPGKTDPGGIHCRRRVVFIRCGNTLHGLAAREIQSPIQTTSFRLR